MTARPGGSTARLGRAVIAELGEADYAAFRIAAAAVSLLIPSDRCTDAQKPAALLPA
ncbi:hypothetical protein [Nonomuraea endophytica]|uniref:hypothetical protein n=1 Tax=Nonomuraea endophytica TaxID=714136 RepID=UPI0037C5AF48